jgi:hypothetical protein
VFAICLVAFAVTTFSLAYYVRNQDIKNPDITDWNVFLDDLNEQAFCLYNNQTTRHQEGPQTHHHIDHVNVSFLVNISFIMTDHFIPTQQLHGSLESVPNSSLTIDIPADMNVTSCLPDQPCDNFQTLCVTLHGPKTLFPRTNKSPPTCKSAPPSESVLTFVDRPCSLDSSTGEKFQFHMKFIDNPELTVMMTIHEHSIMDLHLMHTTYFLLAMVLMLVCFATFRGKPRMKLTLSDKALLDGQI